MELAGSRVRLVSVNMNLYLNSASFSALNVSPVNAEGEEGEGAGNQLRKRFGYDVGVEASWAWLEKTMEEARKKGQNVSLRI